MDLNCGKCGQRYLIPDNRLEEKSVFFHCEKCGHRIVIKTVREGWYAYQPFKESPFTISDLPSAIYHSFSRKGVLVPFISLSILFSFLTLIFFLVYKNADFFVTHHLFSAIFLFIVYALSAFIYDTTLYLCSLNAFHRIDNMSDITYSEKSGIITSDIGKILFFSLAGTLTLFLISLPVYALNSSGLIYAALFLPVFLAASLLAALVFYAGGLIYSFIAFNSRTLRQTISAFFKMVSVEHINLIIYAVTANAFNAMIFSVIISLLICSAAITSFSVLIFLNTGTSSVIASLIAKTGISGTTGTEAFTELVSAIEPAIILSTLFISIILIFISAWMINLRQTLYSAMIKIFDSNPGRSVPGWVTALSAVLLFTIIWFAAVRIF